MDDTHTLLTRQEAAQKLRVSVRGLDRLVEIERVTVGRRVLFRSSAINEFIARNARISHERPATAA